MIPRLVGTSPSHRTAYAPGPPHPERLPTMVLPSPSTAPAVAPPGGRVSNPDATVHRRESAVKTEPSRDMPYRGPVPTVTRPSCDVHRKMEVPSCPTTTLPSDETRRAYPGPR